MKYVANSDSFTSLFSISVYFLPRRPSGLKMNRTNTIALILPTVWHPFFSELAYNIEKNLRALNYKMILCNSEGDYKIELDYITMAKQNQVDGIIAITYSDIEAFISSNLPMVSVDRFFNEEISIGISYCKNPINLFLLD